MLRFITNARTFINNLIKFQYIPCYGLSTAYALCNIQNPISIHPMLRFIVHICILRFFIWPISIHPMLRFIRRDAAGYGVVGLFQYIPCYGLSGRWFCFPCGYFKFQYIPCYGLSVQTSMVVHGQRNFNTSHVTVYRSTRRYLNQLKKFQYIPCYGLSGYYRPIPGDLTEFQYIPRAGCSDRESIITTCVFPK